MGMVHYRRIGEFLANRFLLSLVALIILVGLLWAFRITILRTMGDLLIDQDQEVQADAVYVLGGSPIERGGEAARLLGANKAPVAICTGENINHVLEGEGFLLTDARLSRNAMLRAGADTAAVKELTVGTSTWEEAAAILEHARRNGSDTIIVVTTEFHLRRVKRVFRKQGKGSGITVIARGARSQQYDSDRWWESEEGLLMVNNEYVKSLYYLWKY